MRGAIRTFLGIFSSACLAGFLSVAPTASAATAANNKTNIKKCSEAVRRMPEKHPSLKSSVCDRNGNRIDLHYSSRSNRVWLASKRFRQPEYTVSILEKGANPEPIAADGDTRILFGTTAVVQGREFLVLTVAERTLHAKGKVQCETGEEIYLRVFELVGREIFERNMFLAHSCAQSIGLDSDAMHVPAIRLDGNTVRLRWLEYPKYKNEVEGEFNLLDNRLWIRG